MKPIKFDMGLRIRDYLSKKKYSQAEIADGIDMSRQTLNAALSKKDMKVSLVLNILAFTNGDLSELIPEFCSLEEDHDQLKEYMQDLIRLQKQQIEELNKQIKKP